MLKIVVTVSEDTMTNTDYIGFEGATCLAESERFHTLLAQFGVQMETTSKTPKPELLAALATQQAEHLEPHNNVETEE